MHYFDKSEHLEIKRGQIVRIVTAHSHGKKKHKPLDVVRYWEDGKVETRNIDMMYRATGWLISWPDECGRLEKWFNMTKNHVNITESLIYDRTICGADLDVIYSKYPDFKWIVKKAPYIYNADLFRILNNWKKWPSQVEALMAAGCYNLACNKNTYTAKNQREIIDYIRSNPGCNPTYSCLQTLLKYGITIDEFEEYQYWQTNYGIRTHYNAYKWLKEKGLNKDRDYIVRYNDYKKMCTEAGHNFHDPYWYKPKQIGAAHSKVMEEIKRIRDARTAKANEAKYKKFLDVAKKLAKKITIDKKWKCYVPQTVEDVSEQAKKLNQCLISCDYIGKMANRKCTLVFVTFNGRRIATAEIVGKEIRQFYGNEHSKNMKPGKKATEILNKWLNEAA